MTISGVRDLLSQETHFPGVRSPKSDNSPNQTSRDPDKVSGFRYFMERGQWSIKILSSAEYNQYVFPNSIWSFLETCPSWKACRSISCTLLLYLCSREKLVCFAHHNICAGRSSKFCNCLSPLPDYVARNVTGENHDHVFFFSMFEQNLGTSILRWMSLPPPRCRLALLPLSVSLSRWEYCIALEIESKCHVINE